MCECMRKATYEELQELYNEIMEKNDSLELINELLVKTIKNLRSDSSYFKAEIHKLEIEIKTLKKEKLEIKKDQIFDLEEKK